MNDLTNLTITQARAFLKSGKISAVELTMAYLQEIEKANKVLNAYVTVTAEQAYAMAANSDALLARGDARPLEGIPLGIKDLFATRDVHTQACSRILEGFVPTYESTITLKLWADGAVMLGKLNMDEFAMGSSNETSCYGAVINPWRRKDSDTLLVPGGSSGGSAAAVAARLCAGAMATDTGGSIRQPASFTGTVGIKPTYGRCSRYGMIAFASSLDQAGPIARNVQDCAILLGSIASFDPKDSTSANIKVPDYESSINKSIKGVKIGMIKEYQTDIISEDIQKLLEQGKNWLKSAGATVVDISLPHVKYALATYYIIASAEASSNLARYDGMRYGLRHTGKDIIEIYENTRSAGFGREVKRRILIGTYVLSGNCYSDYYLKAQKFRHLIRDDFNKAFASGIEAILTPATPSTAFEFASDKEREDSSHHAILSDIFTVTSNIAGLPALCIPTSLSEEGLPLGLQLIGRPFDEEKLFQIGNIIEQIAGTLVPTRWW